MGRAQAPTEQTGHQTHAGEDRDRGSPVASDPPGREAPRVVAVDLGNNRGTFFRLQAGPLDSRDAAEALCAALKARNLDCLVVAP